MPAAEVVRRAREVQAREAGREGLPVPAHEERLVDLRAEVLFCGRDLPTSSQVSSSEACLFRTRVCARLLETPSACT